MAEDLEVVCEGVELSELGLLARVVLVGGRAIVERVCLRICFAGLREEVRARSLYPC